MPKLSIITINYNDSAGLQKTLDSIALQTFTEYESIVIDGGSNDESISVIKSFINSGIKSYKWISEPDNGIYNAMNKGIQKANGEYCFFLNSGDYLINTTVLERVFSFKPTCDVVYGNLVVHFKGKFEGISKGKDTLTLLDLYSSVIKHQASFIKRELFDRFGYYDESLKIVADWAFFLKAIGFNNATFQYINIDIACFDNNGFSNNNPELCKAERRKVLDEYMPAMMQSDYLLLQRFNGIQWVNQSKWAWFLFRGLVKMTKLLLQKKQ